MAVQYTDNWRAARSRVDRAALQLVRRTALSIEADIKRDMASEKHGRVYGDHVASAPGEAPAIDTGVLVNSVQTSLDGAYAAEVGSPQETAPILETTLDRPAFARAGKRAKNTFRRNAERLT
ncbi:MAG: hypothetical protein LC795_15635 [Acidobacteria bacterium]|nr:hypothetical protein [Acidobacteriota bacterium]MCA1620707.1 hypothetical protein [Acidobacteriota bacterium]